MNDIIPSETVHQEEKPVKKKKEISLFDVINDVSSKKSGLLNTPLFNGCVDEDIFDETEFRKLYNISTINKALGSHPDALFILDALNKKGGDPLFHHEILMLLLPGRLRKGKWVKEVKDEKIQIIADHYEVRYDIASQYARFVTDEELQNMKK